MADRIVVEGLAKRYGSRQVVRDVSFRVGAGEVFGLLGQNGAGKTTTLECLLGLRRPDAGRIIVDGIDAIADPRALHARVGAQLQATAVHDALSVREAVRLFAACYPSRADAGALLARFGLADRVDARFATLSGGQKQRLAVVLALINDPTVVVFDEPTVGLDPQTRHELHQAIRELRRDGRSVVLTTHHLDEAAELCDRIAVIDRGSLIATGTPAELLARARAPTRIALATAPALIASVLSALPAVSAVEPAGGGWSLTSTAPTATVLALARAVEAAGVELTTLSVRPPTLEEVFLELTGRSPDGSPASATVAGAAR